MALARLNSGPGARLGLYQTNGARQIFPGSPSFTETSFWQLIPHLYSGATSIATPGNSLLGQYLTRTHEPGAPTCASATFNKALLDCIDKNGNNGLSPAELVAAARALKLNVGSGGGGDHTAPQTTITDHPSQRVRTHSRKKRVTFEFRSSEAHSSFECKLDREVFADCSSPYKRRVKSGRGRGRKHTFTVRATDAAHNTDPTPATFEFRVKRVG